MIIEQLKIRNLTYGETRAIREALQYYVNAMGRRAWAQNTVLNEMLDGPLPIALVYAEKSHDELPCTTEAQDWLSLFQQGDVQADYARAGRTEPV